MPCYSRNKTLFFIQKRKYKPLGAREAAGIISEIKKIIPGYCRIMRIQRDIPSTQIAAGPIRTNLRAGGCKNMQGERD